MDQEKIGRFIAERRRAVSLTQMQLAEKLNITDRAVSKWERGKSLPDASIMLELCEILDISVNELLCGEDIDMENKKEIFESIEENAHSNIKSQTTVIEGDYTYDNEYLYFSEISRDSLVHKHIVDKVKYFFRKYIENKRYKWYTYFR